MEERASLFMFERQFGKDSLVGAWITVTLLPTTGAVSAAGA